ncbi:glycosyltransferase [bacterium]|jgi:beta-1,4-mannosyltransferase|nr:glycosyltransferase [bacterium]
MNYTIAIFPYGNDQNPYQFLTKTMFEQENKTLLIKNNSLFPLLKNLKFDYLYLDWLSPYCISSNIFKTFIKTNLFLLQILILKILNKKIIWNVHNLYDHEKRSHYIDKQLHKIMFFLSTKIRFFSKSAKESFLNYYNLNDNNKIVSISHPRYNDFYNDFIFKNDDLFKDIKSGNANVLFFGNIREYKGINSLLNSIDFNKLNVNIKFIIAGKKQDNFDLIKKNNITYFIQYIKDENLKELFDKSTVVILPYEQIMTSGMLYLCMYFKKPVLCPPLPFFVEVLGEDYPYYYNDTEELYKILNELDKNICLDTGKELYIKSELLDYEYMVNNFKNKVFS